MLLKHILSEKLIYWPRNGNLEFSIHHRVQTGSGAHPASYPMGTTSYFPGGKATGSWSWSLTSF